MSLNDSILNLLNLKDKNIKFFEEFYSEGVIKGIECKFFHATLTYSPKVCYSCAHIFDSNIIKHGFKTSTIKIPSVSGFNAYLKLKKQRYLCRHCSSTFTLKTNVVNKHCCISNNTKISVALRAKDKISEKDIARYHNVSHSTVNRVIDSFYLHYKPNFNYLPKHLSFDEFKSVKQAAGAMSFIFIDSERGNIIDIVEDRRLHVLTKYFSKFSKAARNTVETIVVDMYSPYISLIKALFPQAKIIIDKFHIVQLLNRSLNKTRIKIMNKDKHNYNKLKKYWKLILKDTSKIDSSTFKYHRSFRKLMSEAEIINYLLDLDPELKASYSLYHKIRYYLKTKDFNSLNTLIHSNNDGISNYMHTSIRTLRKYIDYINSALVFGYTNGTLEGINNKIKVIKRIAFGFRSFYHFKNRILITQNLATLKVA